jgi:hypothetical protein
MEIVKKLKSKTKEIRATWCAGGKAEAEHIQTLAVNAMMSGRPEKGVKDSDWEEYMRHFNPTDTELNRLMGWDDDYMRNDWAKSTLAYIVANGMCTDHTKADTTKNMEDDLLEQIDGDYRQE